MIKSISRAIPLVLAPLYRNCPLIDIRLNINIRWFSAFFFFFSFKKRRCICAVIWMIYKNYISDKILSGLDIYISIFLLVFIITVGRFYYYYYCYYYYHYYYYLFSFFFCKLWRLVNANCNFCIFIFCIIFTLIWLVLIRNIYICYLLLTCSLV